MTHTDLFEEIVDTVVRDICSVSVAPAAKSKVREIVLSVLHHIREETEKEMIEKVIKEWNKINRLDHYDEDNDSYWENLYGNCHAISMHICEHDKFRDFLSHLERDNTTQL